MRYTYISADNTATNGTALGADNQDVVVYRIVVGAPVNSGNIIVYDKYNPIGGSTSNVAAKISCPASIPTSGAVIGTVVDFGEKGLHLGEGGAVTIDQTMQVTVLWDLA